MGGSQRDPGNKHNHSSNSTLIANVLRTKTRKLTLYNQVWFLVTLSSSHTEHVAGSLSNENIECSLTDCISERGDGGVIVWGFLKSSFH